MIYCYDNAIAADLENSFNTTNIGSSIVKVMDEDQGLSSIAQAYDDKIPLPMVLLTRYPDTPIDKSRMNFTQMHRGVSSVIDTNTNNLYYEKAIPIELSYDLTVLTSNTADRDELVRELMFKYTSMYFITFELPYECKRKVRFGVRIDPDKPISSKSGVSEYFGEGTIYQSIIPLKCEGCVLVSYTPAKLQRSVSEIEPVLKRTQEP